jgi:hypothetical protein
LKIDFDDSFNCAPTRQAAKSFVGEAPPSKCRIFSQHLDHVN